MINPNGQVNTYTGQLLQRQSENAAQATGIGPVQAVWMLTNETGGKSRSPILIASQVELQTTQSVNQASGIRQETRFATAMRGHSRVSAAS